MVFVSLAMAGRAVRLYTPGAQFLDIVVVYP
jgi:hypothetical protein